MGISTTEKIKEAGGGCGFRVVIEGLAEKVVSEQRSISSAEPGLSRARFLQKRSGRLRACLTALRPRLPRRTAQRSRLRRWNSGEFLLSPGCAGAQGAGASPQAPHLALGETDGASSPWGGAGREAGFPNRPAPRL